MIKELEHHFERHRRHVGANARCFDNVKGMTNAGRQYLGFPIVVVVDFDDVTDEFQTVLTDIIESAHERADVSGHLGICIHIADKSTNVIPES